MIRSTLIELNSTELNYYPLTISLNICIGRCNFVDDWSTKICALMKIEYVNVKRFKMTTRVYEAKTMKKHVSSDCKSKFNVQHVIQIMINGILINVNANVNLIIRLKKIIVGILAHVFVRRVDI